MYVRKLSVSLLGIISVLFVATTYCLWFYGHENLVSDGLLHVSFLDVGQGDAIYIRAPNGNDVLIDGGPDQSVMQQLKHVMPPTDHTIDVVIETHPDKDHIAGLVTIFKTFEVKNFLSSEKKSNTQTEHTLLTSIDNEPNLKKIIARRGQRIILDPEKGVFIDILFPDHDTSTIKDTNDASIVARLVYGQGSFLLTGDAPISTESYLIASDGNLLKSNVLKLGHHGSKTSSSDSFLTIVDPDFAIASVGENNNYHHPSPEVVTRVQQHTIPLLETKDLGMILFETDGKTLWRHRTPSSLAGPRDTPPN